MDIYLIAVGTRMPGWVQQGFEEYARRLQQDCRLYLKEVRAEKRQKNQPVAQIRSRELERIRQALPAGARLGLLDEKGRNWSTTDLAARLEDWMQESTPLALVIGGADGVDPELRRQADFVWSLSPLTLPHPLVRILLAEQLYRAWSIIKNHPYHRGEL